MKKYLLIVDRNKASVSTRFTNWFLDGIVLLIINTIISVLSFILYNLTYIHFFYFYNNGGFIWNFFSGAIVTFLYYFLSEYLSNGRTVGKLITGTRVISTDGEKPSKKQYLYRTLYRIVPFEAFTFFGTDGWHDSMTDTRVINYKNYISENQAKEDIENIGRREIA